MLALKKKREAEKKAAEEAAKAAAESGTATPAQAPSGGQVSLLGIGGKATTKKEEQTGTKKSPGEIRIQRGKFPYSKRTNFEFCFCFCRAIENKSSI